MNIEDALWKMLKDDYGISSYRELRQALIKQEKADLSMFVGRESADGKVAVIGRTAV